MSTIPLIKADTTGPGYERLRKQAVELEGVFLNTLMKEMFSSIDTTEESFGGGFAEETWRGMQAEQFANALAETGGIGLADQLMSDLLRLQEANT
jgi:flagellar protein FlgJ